MDDWYSIKAEFLRSHGIHGITYDGDSPMPALLFGLHIELINFKAYPEVKWKIWKFGRPVPEKYWNSFSNHKLFLDDLAVTLKLRNMEDWYSVSTDHNGRGLLDKYNNSNIQLITSVYTEFPWEKWKFKHVPKGFWENKENVLNAMKSIEIQRNIKNPEEWFRVSASWINSQAGSELLHKYGGLLGMLSLLYPNIEWKKLERSVRQQKKQQQLLFNYLSFIFKQSSSI